MAGHLFVNPRAGNGRPSADELVEAARERGLEVHVLGPDDDLLELARAADADVLGAAGGDGTLAAVATVAIERGVPFVCVPFGTRNHFARDLGLDRDDPIAALGAFGGGEERRVDVGRVNGRLFLNNVSVGVYARLVHRRERHRRRRELFARLRALAILLTQRKPLGLSLDGETTAARILLVANNAYTLSPLSIGERERLDEGLLYVYCASAWWPRSWTEDTAERLTVGAAPKRLRVAVDGEPEALETPLEIAIDAQALRVLVPPASDDEGGVREAELVA